MSSTSIASEVELASSEQDEVHATHLSLVPSPDGTIAATGLILERPRLRHRVDAALIRTLDALIAALLLILLLPFILLSALAVRLDSPGPAFFRVERIGWRGGAPADAQVPQDAPTTRPGPALTMDEDERFTRIGRLLAKLKLDELPQLWHVLRGEMSLVGPRPESPGFVELHRRRLRAHPQRASGHHRPVADRLRRGERDPRRGRPAVALLGAIFPQKITLDRMYAASARFG